MFHKQYMPYDSNKKLLSKFHLKVPAKLNTKVIILFLPVNLEYFLFSIAFWTIIDIITYGHWLFAVSVTLKTSPTSSAKHSFGFGVGWTNDGSWLHVQVLQLITLTINCTGIELNGVTSEGLAKSSTWRATAKYPTWFAVYDSVHKLYKNKSICLCVFLFIFNYNIQVLQQNNIANNSCDKFIVLSCDITKDACVNVNYSILICQYNVCTSSTTAPGKTWQARPHSREPFAQRHLTVSPSTSPTVNKHFSITVRGIAYILLFNK